MCMKYILAIILWSLPMFSGATITGSEYEKKVYQIAYATVFKLKDRYSTKVQFDNPLQIKFLSESEIAYTWCKLSNRGNTKSKKFKECVQNDGVEAYYDINTRTMFLRNDLSFDKTYDIGSIVHESTHYVQDMHGLTWRGRNSKCLAWIEYDAMSLELELITALSDIQISDWYKKYVAKWKKKFASQLTGKKNCNINSLNEI